MNARGRPRLDDKERERRRGICRIWAAEIKRNSQLSAKSLAIELGYGIGTRLRKTKENPDPTGRAWRALASGSQSPTPKNFMDMTEIAAKNGWLDPFGWRRYSSYWNPNPEVDSEPNDICHEQVWRTSILGKTLLILLAHARKCGVDQQHFFSDARAEIDRMELAAKALTDGELETRARRVASATAQDLLDGPEYPITSLSAI